MKVSGFTFIRNAIKYDYPIVEAIQSILPICDEFIVAVGDSEDDTLDLIKNIDKEKIRIIETIWDDSLREGGRVLAVETDKAYQAISDDSDWCFYIQGDEVVHEKYLDTIHEAMECWKDRKDVNGLLFDYKHFYGSYDYTGSSSRWYRKEIRVIRKNEKFYSYRDAQGFRKNENEKLNVKPVKAEMFHYGWVKDPRAMQRKQQDFNKLWHDDQWIEQNVAKAEEFDYSEIDSLSHFQGTHPEVMNTRVQKMNWKFDYDISFNNKSFKEKLKDLSEKLTGYRFGEYKNYNLLK